MKSKKNSQRTKHHVLCFQSNLTVTHDLRKKFQEGNKRKQKNGRIKEKGEMELTIKYHSFKTPCIVWNLNLQ